MDDRIDTRRARYFMQVLESGSVRAAAEALNMDPSAVSRAIAMLERECGARLLERRGRGVTPTDAGALLSAYLRRQHDQQRRLLAHLQSLRKMEVGHVSVIAGEGFVDWLMRNSLRGFMVAYPGITIELVVGGTDEIVQHIVDERAQIGLVFQPPREDRLRSHHSHPTPIQAIVLDSHPLAKIDRALLLRDLLPYPGAMLRRSYGVRQLVEAVELSEGVRLASTLTTTSFHAVSQFVAAGLGYTLSTRALLPVRDSGPAVIALPMKNPLLSQGRVEVVSRHGRMLPKAASSLLRMVIEDLRNVPYG